MFIGRHYYPIAYTMQFGSDGLISVCMHFSKLCVYGPISVIKTLQNKFYFLTNIGNTIRVGLIKNKKIIKSRLFLKRKDVENKIRIQRKKIE